MSGRCQEITHAYNGKLAFETQVLDEAAYAGIRARMQPKIEEGLARILYEKGND
jgi:hypothetical protein